jgi:hypothetical protein
MATNAPVPTMDPSPVTIAPPSPSSRWSSEKGLGLDLVT